MTNRMDNLQTVFDRTDWELIRAQRAALILAAADANIDLEPLENWLVAITDAAQMDGYQTKLARAFAELVEDARQRNPEEMK
jgi:hypothetical protein